MAGGRRAVSHQWQRGDQFVRRRACHFVHDRPRLQQAGGPAHDDCFAHEHQQCDGRLHPRSRRSAGVPQSSRCGDGRGAVAGGWRRVSSQRRDRDQLVRGCACRGVQNDWRLVCARQSKRDDCFGHHHQPRRNLLAHGGRIAGELESRRCRDGRRAVAGGWRRISKQRRCRCEFVRRRSPPVLQDDLRVDHAEQSDRGHHGRHHQCGGRQLRDAGSGRGAGQSQSGRRGECRRAVAGGRRSAADQRGGRDRPGPRHSHHHLQHRGRIFHPGQPDQCRQFKCHQHLRRRLHSDGDHQTHLDRGRPQVRPALEQLRVHRHRHRPGQCPGRRRFLSVQHR